MMELKITRWKTVGKVLAALLPALVAGYSSYRVAKVKAGVAYEEQAKAIDELKKEAETNRKLITELKDLLTASSSPAPPIRVRALPRRFSKAVSGKVAQRLLDPAY